MNTLNKYILLVDDDACMRNMVIDILEEHGFVFCQASNGLDAYEIACSESFDLIITDWEMPICNGIEFIEKLKQNPDTKDVPVIMLTGTMTSSQNLKKALELGANDFINKPIDETILTARIHSIFKLFQEHRDRLEVQAQLAISEQTILRNELRYSRELLIHKIAQMAELSRKNNEYVEQLDRLKVYCDEVGKEILTGQIRRLQVDKQQNIEVEFMTHFEVNNPYFFERVQVLCPSLTIKEQKICAMISLSLTNKAIAEFFSNSESTIKSSRKLIRKKLNIDAKIDLIEYLNSI